MKSCIRYYFTLIKVISHNYTVIIVIIIIIIIAIIIVIITKI